jgi:hypothetical protein
MTQLAELTNAQMVAVWNHYADADKQIAKFASAAIGRARLAALLAKIEAPECAALAAVLAPAPAEEAAPVLGVAKGLTPADQGIAAVKADDAARDAIAAEVAAANARLETKFAAAKPAKELTGARGRVAAAKARAQAPAAHAEAPKYRGAWADAAEAAAKGKLPKAPDFSADTHKPYRAKLAALVELAKAGDIAGLEAVAINPTSSSPKALARYRDLCVLAIQTKAGA